MVLLGAGASPHATLRLPKSGAARGSERSSALSVLVFHLEGWDFEPLAGGGCGCLFDAFHLKGRWVYIAFVQDNPPSDILLCSFDAKQVGYDGGH